MKEELTSEKKESSLVVPFLVGGIVGAGIALLLAPKSGKELRQDIKDVASSTKKRITTAVDKGNELLEEGKVAVKTAIEAGKTAYAEERDRHIKAA